MPLDNLETSPALLTPLTHPQTGAILFSVDEQACNHCGLGRLAPCFGRALVILRVRFGQPMHLSSFCRCKEYNALPAEIGGAGGHPRSLHVFDQPFHPTFGCCAIDVRTWDQSYAYREQLIEDARDLGWSIGFHSAFLHLDWRSGCTDLPQAEFNY